MNGCFTHVTNRTLQDFRIESLCRNADFSFLRGTFAIFCFLYPNANVPHTVVGLLHFYLDTFWCQFKFDARFGGLQIQNNAVLVFHGLSTDSGADGNARFGG